MNTMKLFLVLAGLSFSIACRHGSAAVPTRELGPISPRPQELGRIVCMHVMLPDSLPVLGDDYLDDRTLLRLRDELAPVISDTTKLPGHPRRALQLVSDRVPAPDYAAWWPRTADSVALFWRFGLGRGVYVAAAQTGDGEFRGHLFLTVGARHEGPMAFRAKRIACIVPPAA
jgi:hypothetical protein